MTFAEISPHGDRGKPPPQLWPAWGWLGGASAGWRGEEGFTGSQQAGPGGPLGSTASLVYRQKKKLSPLPSGGDWPKTRDGAKKSTGAEGRSLAPCPRVLSWRAEA